MTSDVNDIAVGNGVPSRYGYVFTMSTQSCMVVLYTAEGEAMATMAKATGRVETINLRASQKQKAMIDRAAEVLGRSRSEFMLEAACREAETVLLDCRYFGLSQEAFKRFTAMLDKPPASNPKLQRLLQTRAPWGE